MLTFYLYANGKWNVVPEKRQAYLDWAGRHGKKLNRYILIISLIFYACMLINLVSLM